MRFSDFGKENIEIHDGLGLFGRAFKEVLSVLLEGIGMESMALRLDDADFTEGMGVMRNRRRASRRSHACGGFSEVVR